MVLRVVDGGIAGGDYGGRCDGGSGMEWRVGERDMGEIAVG